MQFASFEFVDLADDLTFVAGANEAEWPYLEAEIRYKFHPAEPDIGICHRPCEILNIRFFIAGTRFDSADTFAAAVYELISEDIEDSEDVVTNLIHKQIALWETECEEHDDSDDQVTSIRLRAADVIRKDSI